MFYKPNYLLKKRKQIRSTLSVRNYGDAFTKSNTAKIIDAYGYTDKMAATNTKSF